MPDGNAASGESRRMFRIRLLVGSAFVALTVGGAVVDWYVDRPFPGWLCFCLVLGILAAYELIDLTEASLARPFTSVTVSSIALLILCHWVWELPFLPAGHLPSPAHRWGLAACIWVGSLMATATLAMLCYATRGPCLHRAAATVWTVAYLGTCSSAIVGIRWLPEGLWGLALLIAVTKTADTGAYIAGKLSGRRQMAPLLSAKKTWEGLIGGLLAGTIVALAMVYTAHMNGHLRWLAVPSATLLGFLLSCWGQVGDLVESWLKRESQRKDSSEWLPGLGGILDVVDSLLWNGPPFAALWTLAASPPAG
jgi:phosphatidate cytidylyltransferase